MQGTRVQALVREDPTCCWATKPVRHNYWTCALEPASHNYWARVPQLLKPALLEPVLCKKRSHRNEKPMHSKEEYPPLSATTESPHAATKTQHSQKKKILLYTLNLYTVCQLYLHRTGRKKDIFTTEPRTQTKISQAIFTLITCEACWYSLG